jgi:hypothetical protein
LRRTVHAHLTLVFEIGLVCDDYHGYALGILDAEDLSLKIKDLFEGAARGDGVDEKKAFA